MKAYKYFSCLLLVGIVSCASITPITPAGKDTFIVAGSDSMGIKAGVNIKASLYQRANIYCETIGKKFLPLNESVELYDAQLRFRCLNEGDPEFVRPNMVPSPNVRIEHN